MHTTTRIIRGIMLMTLFAAITLPLRVGADDLKTAEPGVAVGHPWYELNMMADPILDQALLFYLSHTWQHSSDIGECLSTASRVDPNDPYSWSHEWTAEADRLSALADSCLRRGHEISAGEALQRAADYYSAALHRYPEPTDPQVRELAAKNVDAFKRAMKLQHMSVDIVAIPYENTTLPGYFFRSPYAPDKGPVLIVHQGRDGWAQHCVYIAEAAMKRGYHCLLFDGPGQGQTLRLQGLPFRYDWENVITPVVNYVLSRPDVDPGRVGLMGLSMGGALAPRAAAFEKRLKVCVADPGVLSWREIFYGFFDSFDPSLNGLWRRDPEAFDQQMWELAGRIPFIDWGIKDSMWKHGVKTPSKLMAAMEPYTNEAIISEITCRVLVMDGTVDDFSQGRQFYDALTCPKDYMLFTDEDAGLQHCQVGAPGISSARLFDWLEENL